MYIVQDTRKQQNYSVQLELGTCITRTTLTVPEGIINLQTASGMYKVTVKTAMLLEQKCLNVNIPSVGVMKVSLLCNEQDDLKNYVMNFLQWYFLLITFDDAIAEGDIQRTNILLKLIIPYFYSHSPLSKYLVECIDYILKTEVMLSQHKSLLVRCASFVNMRGGAGKNVASDMEKEHQVKYLKDLIRGLGANKTESSIKLVCSAGPIVNEVVHNFDQMSGHKTFKSTHKTSSADKDLEVLCDHIHKLRPFHVEPGRQFKYLKKMESSVLNCIDIGKYTKNITSIACRLVRNINVDSSGDLV